MGKTPDKAFRFTARTAVIFRNGFTERDVDMKIKTRKSQFPRILVVCILICVVFALLPTRTYAESDSAVDTGTYYYDRIYDDARVWYDRLKELYDSATTEGSVIVYEQICTLTEDEYLQLYWDALVGEAALFADHPTYRYKGRIDECGYDGDFGTSSRFYISAVLGCYLPDSFIARTEARIEQIVKSVGDGDRYTKLHKLAEYFYEKSFYDPYLFLINNSGNYDLASRGMQYNNAVYGLMLENIAVCEGFSQTVKVLCNELDVPCIIVGNAGHAWNLVQMEDGNWYRFDMTAACRLGWDAEPPADYFTDIFLNNDYMGMYGDPFMINVDDVYSITEFPTLAHGQYQYTGSTTDFSCDFSWSEAEGSYIPGTPTFHYRVNEDGKTCTITLYEGDESGDLVIPELLDGYIVTAIDPYAFYYCSDFTGKLILPDTVESIGKAAFAGCYGLTSADLPDNLREIGEGAFIGCKALETVELPALLDTLREYAFYDCDKLRTVTFGSHLQFVENEVFGEINSDLTIYAPAGSVTEAYAAENGLAFQAQGEACSMEPASAEYETGEHNHFAFCEHGARVAFGEHKAASEEPLCGDCCEVCGAAYCAGLDKFGKDILINDNAYPATCVEPEFTGDLRCPCEAYFSPGEYVGDPSSEHVAGEQAPWEYNESHHYKSCVCASEAVQLEQHSGGEMSESGKLLCDVCGAEYGTAPSSGQIPDTTVPQEDNADRDTNIRDIILIAAAVCVVGGASAAYVILRKKRRPEFSDEHGSGTPG